MKVDLVSCGEGHCLAVVKDSTSMERYVWSWGNNKFGQLGMGNLVKNSLPKPISYLMEFSNRKIQEVACGGFHSVVLICYRNGVEWITNDWDIIVKEILESPVW
jgi:alpha-tubulin suppressor-like RCC1 family protein